MKIVIIGAGAAGMFCAANIKVNNSEITVLESGDDILRKVKQSGGGRCNITNNQNDIAKFVSNYPRGGGRLKKPFLRFGPQETLEWFEGRGVRFIEEDEGRIFPESENSEEIANCIYYECRRNNVHVKTNFTVETIEYLGDKFLITSKYKEVISADKIVIAGGGRWNEGLKKSLQNMGHDFEENHPSLFAFKTASSKFTKLAGLSFYDAKISCPALKLEAQGGVLFTHEGLSGPAVFKLSALGAVEFAKLDYKFKVQLSALHPQNLFKDFCAESRKHYSKKLVKNIYPQTLSKNFWISALESINLPEDLTWANFSAAQEKALESQICGLEFEVLGRAATTSAREFVSCGGLSLNDVDFKTMQSKKQKDLFFAGECLNIDAFTGGYNLQAAWTTGYIAAKSIEA